MKKKSKKKKKKKKKNLKPSLDTIYKNSNHYLKSTKRIETMNRLYHIDMLLYRIVIVAHVFILVFFSLDTKFYVRVNYVQANVLFIIWFS
jgi:hypothetical protein